MPGPEVHDGALTPELGTAVRLLADRAREHDGIEALGEQTLLHLAAPGADVRHVLAPPGTGEPSPDGPGTAEPRTPGSGLLGYASVDLSAVATGSATIELVVAPEARRRGLGRSLLATARELATQRGAPRPSVWAHGDLPGARALAARSGLVPTRELWQMTLDLSSTSGTETPEVPGGVTVRPFVPGLDEEAWLDVNSRAFADHPEQGRMTLEDLRARQREPWFDPRDLLLAERAGTVLASTWMKVEPGSDSGELYALGVDPQAQGSGLGRLLTALTVDHLRRLGLREAMLYTEASNTAAVRTYTRAGFRRSRVDVQYS
ncbi:mycothiol synthase [Actinotalea sp. K2]|uniref:mycothiol synthase n=1 Tax=Actinotalea sp. K2 TaxID=2939438 RepID=UPI002017BF42|nr:mycothiol synthase [Actinotalea sp. K2]MCL3861359.1 mycothiol synthase [Actinotalea sp. K2]